MLTMDNVRFGYTAKPVVNVKTLTLPDGENLLVQGASGSGKTSLLFLLAGLLNPQQGRISLDGADLTTMDESRRDVFRGKRIGIVFQQPHLMPALTVLQNVLVAPFMADVEVNKAFAISLLDRLGLAKLADRYPSELSHGQQQRVGVARALVTKPSLVLADEPTSALDDVACEATINLLLSSAESIAAQVVVASHDARIIPHFTRTLKLGGKQ
jgi:ABC-type lipoprotein export system ATPase subunit